MRLSYVIFLLAVTGCAAATSSDTSDSISTLENAKLKSAQIDADYTREKIIRMTTLAAPRTRAWQALLETHTAIGLEKTSSDAEALTATYEAKGVRSLLGKPMSTYFDCGNGVGYAPRADTYSIAVQVMQKLTSISDQETQLATAVRATARNRGLSTEAVECRSNGVLEKRIAELVLARL